MIYERNDSLWVSTGPSIAFELCQVTRIEIKHKNLLISCHVTRLMAALQNKTLSDDYHLRIFEKELYLALLRLMDYCERQRSQFVWVSGLQKLMQKLALCLYLEMVDSLFAFPTKPPNAVSKRMLGIEFPRFILYIWLTTVSFICVPFLHFYISVPTLFLYDPE